MNNFNNNFDQDKINDIKKLVDNGNINEAISKISPEMIENFSKMMNNNQNNNSNNSNASNNNSNYNTYNPNSYNPNKNSNSGNNNSNTSSDTSNSDFDFGNIDMNTILKMKSVMENMNNKNDPRSNLLNSLKPYLRDTKKEKIDQYVNLLYFSKVAEMFNKTNNKKDD